MGGTTCIICRSTWKREKISMFTIPKDSTQRQLWNQACDRLLRENGRICEKHFRKEDFIEYDDGVKMKRKKRLKKNSIPSLFLRKPCSSKSYDEQVFPQLINEELFDETLMPEDVVNGQQEIEDDQSSTRVKITIEPIEPSIGVNSKEIQTNLHDRRSCGMIEVSGNNKIFSISCFYCDNQFPIWSWTQFISHLRQNHYEFERSESDEDYEINLKDTFIKNNVAIDYIEDMNEDSIPSEDFSEYTSYEHVDEKFLNENTNGSENSIKGVNYIQCSLCSLKFSNESKLQMHQSTNHLVVNLPYKCSRCDFRYTNESDLEQHENEHKQAEKYFCHKCNKGFPQKKELQNHLAVHKICSICCKSLNSHCYYKRHMLLHYPPKYICEICTKQFHYKDRLHEHIMVHKNQRDQVCEQCGETFVRKKDLWQHKKLEHFNVNNN